MVKHLPAMQETRVRFLDLEDPLEKEMAIHSSTLAWKIPWTEEPDRLQSMWSQRVRHDWTTSQWLHFLRVWIAWLRHLHVDSAMVEIQGKESNMESSDPIWLWETHKEAMMTWSPVFQNHNLKHAFQEANFLTSFSKTQTILDVPEERKICRWSALVFLSL